MHWLLCRFVENYRCCAVLESLSGSACAQSDLSYYDILPLGGNAS